MKKIFDTLYKGKKPVKQLTELESVKAKKIHLSAMNDIAVQAKDQMAKANQADNDLFHSINNLMGALSRFREVTEEMRLLYAEVEQVDMALMDLGLPKSELMDDLYYVTDNMGWAFADQLSEMDKGAEMVFDLTFDNHYKNVADTDLNF